MVRVINRNGFTLIEVMIALVIATLTLGAYIGANVLIQKNTEVLNERTLALQDANRAIEQIRTASRTTSPAFPANVVAAYPNNSTIAGSGGLTSESILINYADPTANPLVVTVGVTWTSYARRTTTVAVQTYITQR